ncbi:ComEC family competence protein [Ensifer sp. MPMI2T]|nr:ComEC family competence protein [Ensifer sp. MPMI2T]
MGKGERGPTTLDALHRALPFIGSQLPVHAAPVMQAGRRLPRAPDGSALSYRINATAAWIVRRLRAAAEEEADFGHGFVLIPVLLALGSLVWFALAYDIGTAKLAALLCIFGISALLCRGRFAPWRPIAIAPFIFVAGMLLAAAETARLGTVILDGPVTTNLRGSVLSREQDDKGRWRYLVEINETSKPRLRRPPSKATLLARSQHEGFPVGAIIEGKVRLSPPSGPALPGLNDFAFDSFFKGVGAVGFFYGAPRPAADADVAASRNDTSPFAQGKAFLADVREAVGDRIRTVVGGDTGAIAAALITAEERAISRETVETLRAAGLSHVLAISGLNMVLAAGTFLVGARTLLSLVPGLAERLPIKKIAAAGALVMVLLYILIAGGAVSALRSWIMISIMLVAVFFDRVSISLRNVALAAIIIIAWTPSAVAGPGFQMSFAATLALVAGYARWREYRMRERERVTGRWEPASNFAIGSVATSLIGGLATAVYAAAYFHRLPAYGLIANVLATPLISILIMPFGLFAMLLMPFGLEYYPLVVMGQGLDWMLAVARYVASLDGEWVTGRVGVTGFALAAFGGIVVCVLRTRLALVGAVLIIFGGTAIALERQAQRPSIVISEDGQLVGLIAEDAIATNRTRPPDFIFSQWQRALAAANHVGPVVESTSETEPSDSGASAANAAEILSSAKAGGFICRKREWCVGRSHEGWTIVIVDAPELFPSLCEAADLVVAATSRPLPTCKSSRALVVTGETLRRSGAIEIYADETQTAGPPRMRIARSFASTERPWQRHRRYDWRSNGFSPEEDSF